MTYTQPILFLFLAIAALGLFGLRRCANRWLAVVGFAGLFLASWPPVDWLLSRPLEMGYPVRAFQPGPGLQAIVVFGSSVRRSKPERPYPVAGGQTFQRCEYAAWIYSRYGPLPVLASGGGAVAADPPIAVSMGGLLRRSGVAENMIWLEDRSRSTYENAAFCATILRQHGISRVALVVEATSMPRAAACLHKQGIEVMPAPSEFREMGQSWQEAFLPSWQSIRQNEDTLHEAGGLLYYRLRGWI